MKLDELLHFLAEERNFDLRGYKPTTLERRIRKRMGQLSLGDFGSYVEHIRANPGETNQLLDTILINVTEFFRDPEAWEIVANDILPPLLKRLRTGHSFRAWVAGCSTGEEVYSLAMLVAEFFGSRLSDFDIKIYATDVDEHALNIARRGEYAPERLRRVRPEWRGKYFSNASQPRVNRELRRLLIFGRSDLAQDAPISHVQLMVCRNVLIYFDSITQMRILGRLHYALDPGGILFLGKAESKLSYSTAFTAVDSRWRIFQKNQSTESQENSRSSLPRSGFMGNNDRSSKDQELAQVKLYYSALLEVLEPGIFSLDANDVLINQNKSALALWGLSGGQLIGQAIGDSALMKRCAELPARIEESHRAPDRVPPDHPEPVLHRGYGDPDRRGHQRRRARRDPVRQRRHRPGLPDPAAGIHATTISEYVFCSMLMFNRNWPEMVHLQDHHVWPRSAGWYNLSGRELVNQALGIVGLGHIGRRVAQLGL